MISLCNEINTDICQKGSVMPRRSLVIKENQPSITTLLPNCPSCIKPECAKHDPTALDTTKDSDIEVTNTKQSNKLKKRKRKHRSSGSPNDKPNKKPLKNPQSKWPNQMIIVHL